MTELFQPVEFDNSLRLNDRFLSAVYQRGWDKSVANVYELGKDEDNYILLAEGLEINFVGAWWNEKRFSAFLCML